MKNVETDLTRLFAFAMLLWAVQTASAFYDPAIQRWLNRDPMGEAAGLNLYGFVLNNPIQVVDTDGDLSVVAGAFVVKAGQAVAFVGFLCIITPGCPEYVTRNAARATARVIARVRPKADPEQCPKTGEMDQPAIGKPGDLDYIPAMKICIYTCPKQGVVRRYYPEGTPCPGPSITQPWP